MAGVVRSTVAIDASITLSGQTIAQPRPTNILIHARQDDDNNNNAQIQQIQLQEQQDQQRNAASLSSISSSFSSRFTSLSSSASSTISQLQTSLQSAQQAMNTLQQSANDASRSASELSSSAASAMASVQSSAASVQSAMSSSLQASMLASASSAEQVLSISMSSVMVAAVASVSAAVVAEQAAAVAGLPPPPTATVTAAVNVPNVNGAAAQENQGSFLQASRQQNNVLGACTTPEVVLAFAGIVLGAVGLASLGCVVFLWYWKRRPATNKSSETAKSKNSRGSGSGSGLSGESRSSGGSLRQWRIRASTTKPQMNSSSSSGSSTKSTVPPLEVSLKEYKLPSYEPNLFGAKTSLAEPMPSPKSTTASPTKTKGPSTAVPAASAVQTAPAEGTAVSTDDRIFSAWSFTTAGGDNNNNNRSSNGNNNNKSTFFDASSPTTTISNNSARDIVAPLNIYQTQQQQRASRNFSRSSRAMGSMSFSKPRPTSSVYEPFGAYYGLDRISRMEEEWNRSQMQRAVTTTSNTNTSAVAKNNANYTTNYAYYTNSNSNSNNNKGSAQQKESPYSTRYTNKGSADSLAREYHDFVSQLAPVSQYGATPGVVAASSETTTVSASSSPTSRNRAQREPTVPPAGPLPGLPSGNSGFAIKPFIQGLI
ncbi:hypothetical protein SBRCBS47491_003270 [Sporothrix bragantina]|uniref:Uncharacterized protein n=1 Tax=Sporothrix bragantina TaxID=671064 RepID=A0ABP0BDQ4_9PEZI